jgi:hypothetical protein
MKRAIIALVMIAGSSRPVLAENQAWADKLFPDGTRHDFGSVPRGLQLYHRFRFTNPFAAELQIVNTRVSCSCISVVPGVKTLKPHQSSYIDVFMDTRKFTGPNSASIYITVGPRYVSTAALKVSVRTRADVILTPGEANFGVVSQGQTATETIAVEYTGSFPWKVTGVVASGAPLAVTWAERYRRPGEVGYRVTVTLKAEAPAGPLHHLVQLRTNDRECPILPILVEGTVRAPLTVAPAVVSLGDLQVKEVKTQRVVVRGHQPFRIVAIEGLGDGFTVRALSRKAAVHVLTIEYQPARPGNWHKQLTIRTDLDGQATATVTVEARVDD